VVAIWQNSQGRSDFEVKQLDKNNNTSFDQETEVIAGI
jgi:hypothetical protein